MRANAFFSTTVFHVLQDTYVIKTGIWKSEVQILQNHYQPGNGCDIDVAVSVAWLDSCHSWRFQSTQHVSIIWGKNVSQFSFILSGKIKESANIRACRRKYQWFGKKITDDCRSLSLKSYITILLKFQSITLC